MAIEAWVPEDVDRDALGPLPDGVALHSFGESAARDPAIAGADFLVADWWLRDEVAAALPAMRELRVVQATTSGIEWIEPLLPAGVTLANARGVHDVPVSEWVVAAILAMEKRLPELTRAQRERRWGDGGLGELYGKTVLIVGYGSIGRALEARLEPFGVEVLRVARRERAGVVPIDQLPALLPRADIVVLLLPLTPESERLIGADLLARMHPNALLVNAARGGVVDTGALLGALRSGRVRAALDVTDPEPLPPEHPLWSAPNVLITPHVAGSSPRYRERVYALVGEQLRRYAAGRPLLNRLR